jgi:hypothetical protein
MQRHVQCSISRREGLASIALAPVLLSAGAAVAEPVAGQAVQYVDQTEAFQLSLPANWQQAEGMIEGNKSFQGATGARRTIAWYPAGSCTHGTWHTVEEQDSMPQMCCWQAQSCYQYIMKGHL